MRQEEQQNKWSEARRKQNQQLACWRNAVGLARVELLAEGRTSQEVGHVGEPHRMLHSKATYIQTQLRECRYHAPEYLHNCRYVPQAKELMQEIIEEQRKNIAQVK